MSIIDSLTSHDVWLSFLECKKNNKYIKKRELSDFEKFVDNKEYLQISNKLKNREYVFSVPKKHIISKIASAKKRIVYTFNREETYVLKLITFLLHEYDDVFSPNLFSFRAGKSVKEAIRLLKKNRGYYAFKLDISNYFNSIDVTILLSKLKQVLNDALLLDLFEKILTRNLVEENGIIKNEKCGAMAGVPVSAFFANIYLIDIDKFFETQGNVYARYSDDIIIFSDNIIQLKKFRHILYQKIEDLKLVINDKKVVNYSPDEAWDFLGFAIGKSSIDISKNTIEKIKGKIRRKCRALFRWKNRNQLEAEKAIKATIKIFNNKFYSHEYNNEHSWSRWFFPYLTTDKSLKLIDEYFISHLRFIQTGRFIKKNCKQLPYQKLKNIGYRSLVSEFWKYKKQQPN